MSWGEIALDQRQAQISEGSTAISITIEEPADAVFQIERLEQECRENQKSRLLKRLTVALPAGALRFRARVRPLPTEQP